MLARGVYYVFVYVLSVGKGTSVAKSNGQKTLSWGHRTGCWDSHEIICFRCCVRQNGCSREKPCYVSAFWGPKTWNLAEAVRTYQSKKAVALAKKGSSGTGATQAVGVLDPLGLFLVIQKSATVGSGSAGTLTPPLAISTVSLASGHRTLDTGHCRTPDTGHLTESVVVPDTVVVVQPDTGHRTLSPDTGHRTSDTGHGRTPDTGHRTNHRTSGHGGLVLAAVTLGRRKLVGWISLGAAVGMGDANVPLLLLRPVRVITHIVHRNRGHGVDTRRGGIGLPLLPMYLVLVPASRGELESGLDVDRHRLDIQAVCPARL